MGPRGPPGNPGREGPKVRKSPFHSPLYDFQFSVKKETHFFFFVNALLNIKLFWKSGVKPLASVIYLFPDCPNYMP